MATQVQFRRGTTTENNAFTGATAELTVDTTLDTIRVHDGSTAGGIALVNSSAAQTITNKTFGSGNTWQGNTPSLTYGGTGKALTAAAGAIVWSDADSMEISLAGTAGQILTSGGTSAPIWVTPSGITVGTASTATTASNISGGSAGYLVYQYDTNDTDFIQPGASGTFLQSTGASTAPTWAAGNVTYGSTTVSLGGTSTSIAGLTAIDGTTGMTSVFDTPTGNMTMFAAAAQLTLGTGTVLGNDTTQNLWNTVATTVNAFGAATSINVGAATGTMTIANATVDLDGDLNVDGGDITTNATTFNLLETNATTVNAFGAATTIDIGATTGTMTINNNQVVFNTTDSIQIPVGTTAQRDGTPVAGQIRYNSTISSFEGYGPGNAWGSLGGVKDVDQDTYLLTEASAGSDEDTFEFYNATVNTLSLSGTAFDLKSPVTMTVNNTTDASSATTGAVIIDGGVGIAKKLYVGSDFDVTGNAQIDGSATVSTNLTVTGDLTVNGTTTTVNTTNLVVSDSLIELSNGASTATNDAGIVVERGTTGDNAAFVWDESADAWVAATTTATGASTGALTLTNAPITGSNLTASGTLAVTGNSTFTGTINRNPTITLAGDLGGSVTLTDLQNGTLTATIQANSVALGTDTTGNYMSNVTAAQVDATDGIVISHTQGEGSTATISHADTSAQASVNNSGNTFIQDITLDTYGHITGLTSATAVINDATLTMNTSGVGLSGSQTFTANQSTAATFTVTSNATNANTASTIVARDASGNFSAGTITASLSGNATTSSSTTGSSASCTGNAATATTLQTARTINGVSFNGSANITVEAYIENDDSTNATRYLTFVDNTTASFKRLNEDTNLTYNPSTNTLTAGTFSGALSGNASTATSATSATSATTASTANALNTSNNYQMNSLGVGTGGSGTAGQIRATNSIVAYYSDERLKKDIELIPNAVDKVKSLRGVTYHANEIAESYGYDTTEDHVGVLAQDVQKVLPEAVKPAPFDRMIFEGKEISKSGEDYLTVQYEKLVPLLVEAIKEQQKQIDELKAKLGE